MSFIIIIVGTMGISGGTIRRSGLLVRLYRIVSKNTNDLKTCISPERFG